MSLQDDRDFHQWQQDWQAGQSRDVTTEEQIRHYVKRRGGLIWWFVGTDFVIGIIAVPLLTYLGVNARTDIERLAMLSLGSMTIAAVLFGWWNWLGVLRRSAATTAEYVAISAERLRRMRLAWRVALGLLLVEVTIFTVWIWDHLYSGARPHDRGDEIFAWTWLAGFTAAAIAALVWFRRWLNRDAERFDALRRELEG
jgi:hypothetical protein